MSRALGLLDEVASDLDDERYLKAFNLFKDESTQDGFIAMTPSKKKAWLASL
jgi:recombinational DNA repair ATPase RecF